MSPTGLGIGIDSFKIAGIRQVDRVVEESVYVTYGGSKRHSSIHMVRVVSGLEHHCEHCVDTSSHSNILDAGTDPHNTGQCQD